LINYQVDLTEKLISDIEHVEALCFMAENVRLHPMGYYFHSHHRYESVSKAYLVKNVNLKVDSIDKHKYVYESSNSTSWNLIGKHSVEEMTQNFHHFEQDFIISPNDLLAIRCTINIPKESWSRSIEIGHGVHNEKCIFHLLYYVNGTNLMHKTTCLERNATLDVWSEHIHVPRIINKEASTNI